MSSFFEGFREVVKGVFIALVFSLISVLVFALVMDLFNLDSSIMMPVNQFIKIVSIFIASYFSIKGQKGYLKGLFLGMFSVITTCFIFMILTSSFAFDKHFIYDILFCALIGMISGIISVNLKKN